MGAELKLERSGTRDETARDWRIRWDSRITNSPTSLLKVEDGGETFTITNMVDPGSLGVGIIRSGFATGPEG